MSFMQQRKLDDMSQALSRSAFRETLREVAFASTTDLCLCYVHLEGLRDYLNILPQPTLQNILRHVTKVLNKQLRGNDLVAKWDDLEFSVLLSDTPGQAAWNTMSRVRVALSVPIKTDFSGEDLDLFPIIGIAEYRVGDNMESLISNANWALEIAKKDGGMYLLKATEPI
jgi:diguanylate cyclase (GGDEF)-like protein